MSLHHLAIMTEPSLSCLLCFLCMLAIPIFPFLKFEEFLIYLYNYRLNNFDFNYTETSKPPPIGSRSIVAAGKPLRISASQSVLLLRTC